MIYQFKPGKSAQVAEENTLQDSESRELLRKSSLKEYNYVKQYATSEHLKVQDYLIKTYWSGYSNAGIEPSKKDAISWGRKSAEEADPKRQDELGSYYLSGVEGALEQSDVEAAY